MRIGLINENSQAGKNSEIFKVLNESATKAGHEVLNFGMYSADDKEQLTYVQVGILSAILYDFRGYLSTNAFLRAFSDFSL